MNSTSSGTLATGSIELERVPVSAAVSRAWRMMTASCRMLMMECDCVQASIIEDDDAKKVIDRDFLKHRATKLAMKHRQHDATSGTRGRIPSQVAAH